MKELSETILDENFGESNELATKYEPSKMEIKIVMVLLTFYHGGLFVKKLMTLKQTFSECIFSESIIIE